MVLFNNVILRGNFDFRPVKRIYTNSIKYTETIATNNEFRYWI